jgi:hypothetical protein
MTCLLCERRKARRACPALSRTICSVCCGTKRLTEIACPSDCAWLATAREHPAAVVQKQQDHDVALLLPTINRLTERQYQLFFLLQSLIAKHQPGGFGRLIDADVAEAAGTLATSFAAAARGLVFEETPQSAVARRLLTEIRQFTEELARQAGRPFDQELIPVLRSIEAGAREIGLASGGSDTGYLTLMERLLLQKAGPAAEAQRLAGQPGASGEPGHPGEPDTADREPITR